MSMFDAKTWETHRQNKELITMGKKNMEKQWFSSGKKTRPGLRHHRTWMEEPLKNLHHRHRRCGDEHPWGLGPDVFNGKMLIIHWKKRNILKMAVTYENLKLHDNP